MTSRLSLPLLVAALAAPGAAAAFEPTSGQPLEIRSYCIGLGQARDIADYHAEHGGREASAIFRGYRNTFDCYREVVTFEPKERVYAVEVPEGRLVIWSGRKAGDDEPIYAFFIAGGDDS